MPFANWASGRSVNYYPKIKILRAKRKTVRVVKPHYFKPPTPYYAKAIDVEMNMQDEEMVLAA